jgi:hypothetical protein
MFTEYQRITALWDYKCEIDWVTSEMVLTFVKIIDKSFFDCLEFPYDNQSTSLFKNVTFLTFLKAFDLDIQPRLVSWKLNDNIESRKELASFFFFPILLQGHPIETVLKNTIDCSTQSVNASFNV